MGEEHEKPFGDPLVFLVDHQDDEEEHLLEAEAKGTIHKDELPLSVAPGCLQCRGEATLGWKQSLVAIIGTTSINSKRMVLPVGNRHPQSPTLESLSPVPAIFQHTSSDGEASEIPSASIKFTSSLPIHSTSPGVQDVNVILSISGTIDNNFRQPPPLPWVVGVLFQGQVVGLLTEEFSLPSFCCLAKLGRANGSAVRDPQCLSCLTSPPRTRHPAKPLDIPSLSLPKSCNDQFRLSMEIYYAKHLLTANYKNWILSIGKFADAPMWIKEADPNATDAIHPLVPMKNQSICLRTSTGWIVADEPSDETIPAQEGDGGRNQELVQLFATDCQYQPMRWTVAAVLQTIRILEGHNQGRK
ncbi:hypothetical protein BDK51DRAFT_26125 [Blyttiomyces helicus]|uniref:Uncharacterized protein n=1 Tax=Blyttiomyces helicus TaxID=388810 RepID=A0A4P9WSQ6_9FUNG|nr:hypothetical protein BDK51DRAFT_26125 [Blyttiomyces helicus]|eukprot:RKO94340.1 hypothetical protein BDK51DRAFT_26125 [Blyttiomyces helicus]